MASQGRFDQRGRVAYRSLEWEHGGRFPWRDWMTCNALRERDNLGIIVTRLSHNCNTWLLKSGGHSGWLLWRLDVRVVRDHGCGWPRATTKEKDQKLMIRNKLCLFVLGGLFAFAAAGVRADDSALLDVLVRKGILTQKEADKLAAEVSKEPVTTAPQGPNIKIGDWVQELDLYGDIRFRDYYQTYEQQLPKPTGDPTYDENIQRQRIRFRLRLDATFKLADNFFGGVELSTSDNKDGSTTNATYTSGFDNYNIYISRAFIGWAPVDGLTFVVGKQNNPFYTTELNWAPDVGPTGIVERVDFHRLFGWDAGGEPAGYSKDGKTPPPAPAPTGFPLDVSLIAGQFIFYNNNADSSESFDKTDAFMFDTQLLTKLKLFGGNLAVTFGPQVQIWNDAGLGPTGVLANGQPNPATAPNTTAPSGTGAYATLNNANPFPVSTRDEFYLQAPGDITFKIAGIPVSLYWDTTYNVWGPQRFSEVYGPLFSTVTFAKGSTTPIFSHPVTPTFADYFGWLAGIKIGQNKHAGDISFLVDYRQLGLAAADPNINTDDFGESYLNQVGWRGSIALNLTDFVVLQVTGWFTNNLDRNLYGGYATSPSAFPIANANASTVIAVDLGVKF
jgi:Putative porin